MTDQQKTGSLTSGNGQAHLASIKTAIELARRDGFLLEFQSYNFESQYVQLFLWQSRRGEDGVMRRTFEEEITDGYT